LWIILKVLKNNPLAVTVKESIDMLISFSRRQLTKKTKHCKDVLWSRENGKTTFIDTTNKILVLALSKDYHINVSYEDNSCSVHDHKLQLCNEVSKLNPSNAKLNPICWHY
jgi:pyruvate/2-oxoglutarate dehydrogenase complex dihydrolipoamide acyltransferase (E2) component